MASREELMEQVRLKRLREQVAAKRAAVIEPEPAPEDEGLDLQDVRGTGQAVLSGALAGFADEGIGALRSGLDYVLPDTEADRIAAQFGGEEQSFGDRYRLYRDDARASAREFSEENPGTALGLEIGGAILSPLNKVAPGLGTRGTLGRRVGESAVRAGGEGLLYGLGSSEGDLLNQAQDASLGATVGAGMSAALTGLAGPLGKAVSKLRVGERLQDAAGNFKPIHLADPEGAAGKLYRNIVGGAFGGRGALGRQESNYLNKATKLARFADEGRDLVDSSIGTANEVKRVAMSIDDASQVAQDTAKREGKALRKAASQVDTDDLVAINRESLRRSVPQEYAETITEVGTAGQRQAKDAINDAYNKAWGGSVTSPATAGSIKEALAEVGDKLTKKERRALTSILGDTQGGQSSKVVDREIRDLLSAKTSKPMSKAIKRIRGILRADLPVEGQDLLQRADDVYPNYLATLKATGSKGANARDGMFTASELASGAKQAEGWKSAGLGESDLLEYAKPRLAQAAAKKKALEEGASRASNKARRAGQVATASKRRLDRATEGLLNENATAWSQLASTAILGGTLGLPGIAGGAAVARTLASKPVQKAVAGQTAWQEALAEALRKGDTAKYQRILARIGAQQATGE